MTTTLRTGLCLALVLPAAAHAAELRRMAAPSLWVEAYGGGHFFLQDKEDFGHAPVFGLRVGVNLHPHFGLEIGGGFVPTTYTLEDARGPAGRNTLLANPRIDGTFHLVGIGPLLPYVQVGIGFKYFRVFDDLAAGFVPDEAGDRLPQPKWHEIDLQWDAAVGLRISIVSGLALDLNLRYLMSDEPGATERFVPREGDPPGYDDRFDNLELTFGLVGVIGEKPADHDRDGIIDNKDNCAKEAEDQDGFQDDDGCPDLDDDGDGLPDVADRCPRDAEDKDGFHDDDGCPDLDNDADGVVDTADRCPLDAEDKDGFDDSDGCVDPDNDLDRILDGADRCPMEPETWNQWEDGDGCPEADQDGDGLPDPADTCPEKPETRNGFQDKDGCPDELPREIQKFSGVIAGIQFDTNSDQLTRSSDKVLNEALLTLQKFPEIHLEVQGHTSAEGDDASNLDLSQRRASSVVRWFTDRGIPSSRLLPRGLGETKPIAPDTRQGRQKNRRVEFVAGAAKASTPPSNPGTTP